MLNSLPAVVDGRGLKPTEVGSTVAVVAVAATSVAVAETQVGGKEGLLIQINVTGVEMVDNLDHGEANSKDRSH